MDNSLTHSIVTHTHTTLSHITLSQAQLCHTRLSRTALSHTQQWRLAVWVDCGAVVFCVASAALCRYCIVLLDRISLSCPVLCCIVWSSRNVSMSVWLCVCLSVCVSVCLYVCMYICGDRSRNFLFKFNLRICEKIWGSLEPASCKFRARLAQSFAQRKL